MSVHKTGQRFAFQGILLNAALAVIKISAGVLGNAYALIADGVESILDIGSSLVIWSGLKFAAKPPDEEHPYGHGKAEPIAALIVAIFVLFTAAGLAVQSVHEIHAPQQAPPKLFTLVVLVGVVVIKEFLFQRIVQLGDKVNSTALKTEAWHHRSDAITSVAAFVGISIALVGGKGFEIADKIAALVACVVIAANGVLLLIPAFLEIMDTAPAGNVSRAIRETARAVPGVREIDKCHVRKMGLEYYVDIHVLVDGDLSVRAGHGIAHDVKDRLRAEHPSVRDVLVHIEPA
jgi:cation diffusion facilitator family transporter